MSLVLPPLLLSFLQVTGHRECSPAPGHRVVIVSVWHWNTQNWAQDLRLMSVSEWRGRITSLVSPAAFLAMPPGMPQVFLIEYPMGILYMPTTTPSFFPANLTAVN